MSGLGLKLVSQVPPEAVFGPAAARDALWHEAESFVTRGSTMLARARAVVEADRVGSVGLLNARREGLARHLQRYQRFKHGRIFDPVVAHAPMSSKVVARSMKMDCVAMGHVFAAYHDRWQSLRAGEWPAYRRDMIGTADQLQVHLTAELRAIRQLLTIAEFYRG